MNQKNLNVHIPKRIEKAIVKQQAKPSSQTQVNAQDSSF